MKGTSLAHADDRWLGGLQRGLILLMALCLVALLWDAMVGPFLLSSAVWWPYWNVAGILVASLHAILQTKRLIERNANIDLALEVMWMHALQ